MEHYCHTQDISWKQHPTANSVAIKPYITQKEDGLDVTCMLVRVPRGGEVPEHIHEHQDDILFPLAGKATMWVEGVGSFTLEPGAIVRVKKGVRHGISNVTEELIIHDVFCPALL